MKIRLPLLSPSVTLSGLMGLALGGFLLVTPGLAQTTGGSGGTTPPTVRPGAPGQPSQTLSAAEAGQVQLPPHTEADVRFMQDMIHHHLQAVEMAGMVVERTENVDLRLLARKIEASQADELLMMQSWLRARGESAPGLPEPDAADHAGHGTQTAASVQATAAGHAGHGGAAAQSAATGHAGHAGHTDHADHGDGEAMSMPGMLSDEQLEALRSARGLAFDRMFLEFMIYHHLGAIEMVQALFATAGGGQEGEVYQFAAHVDSDQKIEIERMRRLLSSLGAGPDGR
jgi:uncharacterized protein (DUF305 family)